MDIIFLAYAQKYVTEVNIATRGGVKPIDPCGNTSGGKRVSYERVGYLSRVVT